MKHIKFSAIILLFALLFTSCATASSNEIIPEYDASVDKTDIDLLYQF